MPRGPFEEPDSPGIFLVEGGKGIDDLAGQLEGYHYVFTDTPKGKTKDVYRSDEDLVAACEYANEEWEEGAGGAVQTRIGLGKPSGLRLREYTPV